MVPRYHDPVLLQECLHWLDLRPNNVIVDGTLGDGGHSAAILAAEPNIHVIGFDADPEAISRASKRLVSFAERFKSVMGNFRTLASVMSELPDPRIHGLLLDLGVSSRQLDEGSKGFSYRQEAPLRMQLGPSSTQSAFEVVNHFSEEDLSGIIFELGEERNARRIAKSIVRHRQQAPIETTTRLADVISDVIPERHARKTWSRVFQAIRIFVNDELGSLRKVLADATDLLHPGGRIVVISYHSLEDRIVKEFFRFESAKQVYNPIHPVLSEDKMQRLKVLTRRPVIPTPQEIQKNPRARSAKLRAAEKI